MREWIFDFFLQEYEVSMHSPVWFCPVSCLQSLSYIHVYMCRGNILYFTKYTHMYKTCRARNYNNKLRLWKVLKHLILLLLQRKKGTHFCTFSGQVLFFRKCFFHRQANNKTPFMKWPWGHNSVFDVPYRCYKHCIVQIKYKRSRIWTNWSVFCNIPRLESF